MTIFDYPFIYRELNKYLTDKDKLNFYKQIIKFKKKLFFI